MYNDENNEEAYGRLYSWNALTNMRKIAPKELHLPTEQEWKVMLAYLGGNGVEGSKLSALNTGKRQIIRQSIEPGLPPCLSVLVITTECTITEAFLLLGGR
ncbi:FISUMP domain-containing protein [Mucilaginibacter galii]|uniref:FISUMP domain-containing protein n=1 Tax=Mucilaginibacter galii TaxID=2005073 RepID=UPI0016677190